MSHNPLGKLGGLALAAFLQTNTTLMERYAADAHLDIDALIAKAAQEGRSPRATASPAPHPLVTGSVVSASDESE